MERGAENLKETKFKWWFLIMPLLLTAVVLMGAFWDYIIIRIAPKAVLTCALSEVFSQLEYRFRDDPLLFLIKSIDPEGKYTADVKLETTNELLGTVTYDMSVQTDASTNRLFAEGTAATSQKELDLSLYLDDNFAAVSSADLVEGNYYGITYDTFAEDLRSIPLLSMFISDAVLAQWSDSVKSIQEHMRTDYTVSEISEDNLKTFILGVLLLPCEIKSDSVSVGSEILDCQIISYSVSGEEVDTMLAGTLYAENPAIKVTFYLYQNALVMIKLECDAGVHSALYSLKLGINPAEDVLVLHIRHDAGEYDDLQITVTAKENSEERYAETWHYIKDMGETTHTYAFDWEKSGGAMELTVNDAREPILLNLTEAENGFRLETDDLNGLIEILKQDGQNTAAANDPIACVMTVSKGSEIITPRYKNLDVWSMEDFLGLLSGIGSLIGISIGI